MVVTPGWLRRRFEDGVPSEVVSELPLDDGPWAAAAVLVPIVLREVEPSMLLVQRALHLRVHPGQVGFPGGRREAADASPMMTALREAREEVGLDAAQVEVLGCLAEYRTSTHFSIAPVIALVRPPLDLELDRSEVAEVFEAPLRFLLDAANYSRRRVTYEGSEREYWTLFWQGRHIWGATAGILVELRKFLLCGA